MKIIYLKNILTINKQQKKEENKMNDEKLKEVFEALQIDRDDTVAKAYGLTYVDDQLVAKFLNDDSDIYELLDNLNSDKIVSNTNFDYFSLITHGWAAPLNSDGEIDGAPSQHPERRRVRLIVTVDIKNNKDIASIMEFNDDPENLIYDHGNATGALAEAVADLFN